MIANSWPDFLAVRAVTHADHPALLAGSVNWTFADLHDRVTASARRLALLGVGAGDRVGLLARNGPGWVVAAHAVNRLGAVLVPLNVRLTPSEVARQLVDVRVALLLHDRNHADVAAALTHEVDDLRPVEFGANGLGGPASSELPERNAITSEAVHSIIFTSGTTGQPKGAMLTYGNYVSSAIASALHLGHHRDDRWLAAMPLFHVGGLAILMRSIVCGVTVVLHEAFDPSAVNRAIDDERITIVSVVANMLQRMLDEHGERSYPATLRCMLLGGGPAPLPLVQECLRRGVPVAPSYGMTETTAQVATLLAGEVARKPRSAGRPLPLTSLRIERNGEVLPPGEAGDIVVRGPMVTPGYIGREAACDQFLPDGWMRTGDIGRLDDEGYLYVLDRRDDLIISGGENIYPAEVEAVLVTHPGVEEAAVVGVPDERWGQVPIAFVKPRAGAELDEVNLFHFCNARLAAYKIPREIHRVERLPRNVTGKLLRYALRNI